MALCNSILQSCSVFVWNWCERFLYFVCGMEVTMLKDVRTEVIYTNQDDKIIKRVPKLVYKKWRVMPYFNSSALKNFRKNNRLKEWVDYIVDRSKE